MESDGTKQANGGGPGELATTPSPGRSSGSSGGGSRRRSWAYEIGQSAGYTGSQAFVKVIAGVSAVVIARELGATQTGDYQFVTSFLAFVSMFFEFGLFVPASRLAARTERKLARRVFGSGIVAFIPVGIAYLIAITGLSFGVDSWFHVRVGTTIRLLEPVFIIYPFQFVVTYMSQGMRRLHVLSITQAAGAILGLGLMLSYIYSGQRLTLASALLLISGAQATVLLVAMFWLQPVFAQVRRGVGEIIAETRRWGFENYVGRIFSVGTYNMDVLMVAVFTNARQVAFYSLAGGIASVIGLPASGITAALFPRLTREGSLRRSWKLAIWFFAIAGALLVWALAGIFVRDVLGPHYLPVIPLVLPLALAAAIRSVTGLYNTYLSANARGRELRQTGFVLTGSNLVLNFALIPPFGATGAAWASFLALVANYIGYVIYYRRVINEVEPAESRP
jgi:O-antigen/teichoic acid export membrane protein